MLVGRSASTLRNCSISEARSASSETAKVSARSWSPAVASSSSGGAGLHFRAQFGRRDGQGAEPISEVERVRCGRPVCLGERRNGVDVDLPEGIGERPQNSRAELRGQLAQPVAGRDDIPVIHRHWRQGPRAGLCECRGRAEQSGALHPARGPAIGARISSSGIGAWSSAI